MKATLVGAVGGASMVLLAAFIFSHQSPVFAQRVSAYEPTAELIALPSQIDNSRQQIVVIDPIRRAMCVYHVEPAANGIITINLKSARNIAADLQIDTFNGTEPLPESVRKGLGAGADRR